MKASRKVSPRAVRDLDDYASYLANEAGILVGLRFLDAAHEAFDLLATQPQMGWKVRSRDRDLQLGVRHRSGDQAARRSSQ